MSDAKALQDFNKASPPQPGTLTKEGIYIGRLTGKDRVESDYFAAPTDVQDSSGIRIPLCFYDAEKYAKNAITLGHNDWAIPAGFEDVNGAPDVLNAMFNSKSKRAFKGTFDETGSDPVGRYLSSSPFSYNFHDDFAKTQEFCDGDRGRDSRRYGGHSVRLVRSLAV